MRKKNKVHKVPCRSNKISPHFTRFPLKFAASPNKNETQTDTRKMLKKNVQKLKKNRPKSKKIMGRDNNNKSAAKKTKTKTKQQNGAHKQKQKQKI